MDDDNYNGIRKCSHRSYDSLLSLVRIGITYLVFLIGIIASTKLEKLK